MIFDKVLMSVFSFLNLTYCATPVDLISNSVLYCFPAIFSVPEEMCAVQYAKAILNYSSGNATNSDRLKEIHFIDKNPSIIRLIQKTFKTMIEDQKETDYDIMKYVTKTSPGYGNASGYSRSIRRTADTRDMGKTLPVFEETSEGCVLHAENSSRVVVYDGNILEAHKKHITCIVCADDNTGRGKGGLANALMSNSRGFSYGMDKHEAFNCKWPKEGDLVISSGKGTGYENVLHAVLWGTGRATDQKGVVLEAYKNILKESSWRKFSTVAIPILGTGIKLFRCIVTIDPNVYHPTTIPPSRAYL